MPDSEWSFEGATSVCLSAFSYCIFKVTGDNFFIVTFERQFTIMCLSILQIF